MPFVTLAQIKPFISDGLYSALSKETNFADIEAEAAIFINSEVGIEIPSLVADAPGYIKRPAAMIIQKFARNKLSNISSESYSTYESMVEKEFNWAVNFLKTKVTTDRSENLSGTINGVDSW
jgi:hypothetical protein